MPVHRWIVRGQSFRVTHMDVGNADIAGANICPALAPRLHPCRRARSYKINLRQPGSGCRITSCRSQLACARCLGAGEFDIPGNSGSRASPLLQTISHREDQGFVGASLLVPAPAKHRSIDFMSGAIPGRIRQFGKRIERLCVSFMGQQWPCLEAWILMEYAVFSAWFVTSCRCDH